MLFLLSAGISVNIMSSLVFKNVLKKIYFVKMSYAIYTEQQKKRIFCIFGILYKLGFIYQSNDM